jgi:hypothetical protein
LPFSKQFHQVQTGGVGQSLKDERLTFVVGGILGGILLHFAPEDLNYSLISARGHRRILRK